MLTDMIAKWKKKSVPELYVTPAQELQKVLEVYRKCIAKSWISARQLRCFACLPLWIAPQGDQLTPQVLLPMSTLSGEKPEKKKAGTGSSPNVNSHLSTPISQLLSPEEGQSTVWKHADLKHRCQRVTKERLHLAESGRLWQKASVLAPRTIPEEKKCEVICFWPHVESQSDGWGCCTLVPLSGTVYKYIFTNASMQVAIWDSTQVLHGWCWPWTTEVYSFFFSSSSLFQFWYHTCYCLSCIKLGKRLCDILDSILALL